MPVRQARPVQERRDEAVWQVDAEDIVDVTMLYETEAPRLRRWLHARVPHDRAADLVQAAFARLLGLGGERLARIDQPQAYLTRIAGNLMRDDAKMAVRRAACLHMSVEDCVLATADPTLALEARDMLKRANAAIEALPDRTREIFMAHRFEDLTYPQIAARLGVSVKTVEKHVSLALRHLHQAVERQA